MFSDFNTIKFLNDAQFGVIIQQTWHGTSHYDDVTMPFDCLERKSKILEKISQAELEKAKAGYPQQGWYKNFTYLPASSWEDACTVARENGQIDYL